jgi:pyruvate dehydrogenase E1 component
VTLAALSSLAAEGVLKASVVADAVRKYEIDPDAPPPWTV